MTDELNTQQTNTTPAAQVATPDGAGNQPDTSRTFTQADVDKLMAQARAEGRQAASKDVKEKYGDPVELAKAKAELDQRKASEMTEQQKIAAELESLRNQLAQKERETAEANLSMLRMKIGQEKGLVPAIAELLRGTTKEELDAHADVLLASIPATAPLVPQKPTPPNLGAAEGTQQARPTVRLSDDEKEIAQRAGMSVEKYIQRKVEAIMQRGVNNNDG
jgi:hypothetical protein